MKALLILGMQVDLLPGGPAEVPDSQELVAIINSLAPSYDMVVAANFDQPADHVVFAANHLWRRPGQTIPINGRPVLLQHINCVPGSFGAEMIPGLKIGQPAFTALMGSDKQLPPHSAFFDENKDRETGLAAFFASQNVSKIDIAGMPLEGEVQHSFEDAISLGFQAKILVEACRGRMVNTSTHD
ncbi:MAG: isochorismatase family protein [Saprospiraceae bacterium]|nr:isochorismatase family protein [Saprospiraceae bacterium]